MPDTLIRVLVALCYAAAAFMLARELWRAQTYDRAGKWWRLSPVFPGLLLHAVQLVLSGGAAGIDLGFYNALSLASFAIVALLLLLAAGKPIEMLGIGLFPLAGITVLAGVLQDESTVPLALASELQFHILSSLLAYAVLSVGAMQAILVGVQAYMLRNHQPGGFVRALPPLNPMEGLLFQLLAIGFVLLSISLASGFFYLHDMFAQHLVHKTVLSLAAWLVFGTLLVGRHAWGWRGQRAVRWTLVGLGFLLLAYFGSKFVLELLLQRGA